MKKFKRPSGRLKYLPSRDWYLDFNSFEELYLYNETYRQGVLFVWPAPRQVAEDTLRHYKVKEADISYLLEDYETSAARTLTVKDNNKVYVFLSPKLIKEKGSYLHNVIAHECLHAVQSVLGNRGLDMTQRSAEAYCYLLGHYVQKITERVFKLKLS